MSEAIDPNDEQELPEELQNAREQIEGAWLHLASSSFGRIALDDLHSFCEPEVTLYSGERDRTHIRIGRVEVWQWILTRLGLTQEGYLRWKKETDDEANR